MVLHLCRQFFHPPSQSIEFVLFAVAVCSFCATERVLGNRVLHAYAWRQSLYRIAVQLHPLLLHTFDRHGHTGC